MAKFTPDLELMTAATLFLLDPLRHRERLAFTAEDYLTTPGLPEQPYVQRLAIAAQKVAAAPRDQMAIALPALREILAVVAREDSRRATVVVFEAAMLATPISTEPCSTDHLWQRRADTGID